MDNNNENKPTFASLMGALAGKIIIATAIICILIVAAAIITLAVKGFMILYGRLF